MINLILIVLLIQQLYVVFTKNRPTALSCGIMAISPIGSNKINWARVKLLLLSNESRGRHSTGLYSNKSSLKMVKAATPFVKELVISPEADGITPLLGHTRAPSVGTDRSISGAQPIVEVDEEGENVFAIIHNGTIHNMEELADADDEITFVTTDTDTQILSKFIQQEKYSVLNEYYGAASLIWHTKKDPDAIYVFRGESSQSSYSAYVTEERPLHMGSDETGIYFSSTKDSLVEMFDSKEAKESVVEVVANKVLRFENGVESVIFEADRSTVSQTKKVVKAVTHNHHTHNRHNAGGHSQYKGRFPRYDDAYGYGDDEYYGGSCGYPDTSNENKVDDYSVLKHAISISNWVSSITETDANKLILDESIKTTAIKANQVFYYKGVYRTINAVLNGNIYITEAGLLGGKHMPEAKQYTFVKGVMLKEDAEFVKVYSKIGAKEFGTAEFNEALKNLTRQPVPTLEVYNEIAIETFYFENKVFTGIFKPLFLYRGILEFHAGYIAAAIFHPIATIGVGDRIRTLKYNTFKAGTVVSVNSNLGVATMTTAYGETVRVDESEIIEITSKKTVVVKEIPKTDEELAKEKLIKKEKLKLETEKTFKLKQEKVLSDMNSIISDAHEELNIGLNAATEAKAKVPKLHRRIFNLMGHAVRNLELKQN